LLTQRLRLREVRITHYAIPSPNCFAPESSIQLLLRFRLREVRETHFAIPFPKYFIPFIPK